MTARSWRERWTRPSPRRLYEGLACTTAENGPVLRTRGAHHRRPAKSLVPPPEVRLPMPSERGTLAWVV
eukprot:scaffold15662_cov109-Isochrysis_galbana.AAC.7